MFYATNRGNLQFTNDVLCQSHVQLQIDKTFVIVKLVSLIVEYPQLKEQIARKSLSCRIPDSGVALQVQDNIIESQTVKKYFRFILIMIVVK